MSDMSAGPKSKGALFAVCLLQGGYMLFDGMHRLLAGSYFGGRLGPWAAWYQPLASAPAPWRRCLSLWVSCGWWEAWHSCCEREVQWGC